MHFRRPVYLTGKIPRDDSTLVNDLWGFVCDMDDGVEMYEGNIVGNAHHFENLFQVVKHLISSNIPLHKRSAFRKRTFHDPGTLTKHPELNRVFLVPLWLQIIEEACAVASKEVQDRGPIKRYLSIREAILNVSPRQIQFPVHVDRPGADFFDSEIIRNLLNTTDLSNQPQMTFPNNVDISILTAERIGPTTPAARELVGRIFWHLLSRDDAIQPYILNEYILNADLYFGDFLVICKTAYQQTVPKTFTHCATKVVYDILSELDFPSLPGNVMRVTAGFYHALTLYCEKIQEALCDTEKVSRCKEWFMHVSPRYNSRALSVSASNAYRDFLLDAIMLTETAILQDRLTLGVEIELLIEKLYSQLKDGRCEMLRIQDYNILEAIVDDDDCAFQNVKSKSPHWHVMKYVLLMLALSAADPPEKCKNSGNTYRLHIMDDCISDCRLKPKPREPLTSKEVSLIRSFQCISMTGEYTGDVHHSFDVNSVGLDFRDISVIEPLALVGSEHMVKIIDRLNPEMNRLLDLNDVYRLVDEIDEHTLDAVYIRAINNQPYDLFNLKNAVVCCIFRRFLKDFPHTAHIDELVTHTLYTLLEQVRRTIIATYSNDQTLSKQLRTVKHLLSEFSTIMDWQAVWTSVVYNKNTLITFPPMTTDMMKNLLCKYTLNFAKNPKLCTDLLKTVGPVSGNAGKALKDLVRKFEKLGENRVLDDLCAEVFYDNPLGKLTEPQIAKISSTLSKGLEDKRPVQKRLNRLFNDLCELVKMLRKTPKAQFAPNGGTRREWGFENSDLTTIRPLIDGDEDDGSISSQDDRLSPQAPLDEELEQQDTESLVAYSHRLRRIYSKSDSSGTAIFLRGLRDVSLRVKILDKDPSAVESMSLGEALTAARFIILNKQDESHAWALVDGVPLDLD